MTPARGEPPASCCISSIADIVARRDVLGDIPAGLFHFTGAPQWLHGDRKLNGGAPSKTAREPSNWGAVGSEEHTSELPSIMRRSYAVFCLNNKNSAVRHLR